MIRVLIRITGALLKQPPDDPQGVSFMDRTIITNTSTSGKAIHCPACGVPLHPPAPHSCGKTATERRIDSALERAVQRGHYAQYIGTSERLQAVVYHVKSTSGTVSGYTVYTYHNARHGGFEYLPGLWAVCECRAAQQGYPCDHGAKASRAATRRLQEHTQVA
jgi:hypothetical protein